MSGNAGEQQLKTASPSSTPTILLAVIAATVVFLAVNAIANRLLIGASAQIYESYYDGCVALFTLAVPSFLGGLLISRIVRASAHKVSMAVYAVAAIVGMVHPYWQVPIVSPHSAHSAFMHYMITNPIVILAFGTLGGWLGGEFATGRFMLDDREPPHLPGMEED